MKALAVSWLSVKLSHWQSSTLVSLRGVRWIAYLIFSWNKPGGQGSYEARWYIHNASMYNQVALLEGLPYLEELPRGDFLCDALEWLDETDPDRCSRFLDAFDQHVILSWMLRLRLGICEFWASEDYFFHHSEQLRLVSTVCPNIRKMLFMFRWDNFTSYR